jgi:prephenate dehydratase
VTGPQHPRPAGSPSAGVSTEPFEALRRLAYLGPEGTFTEAALRALVADWPVEVEAVATSTVPAALAAVRNGSVGGAVVAMENSIEGSVNATLDELSAGSPLVIAAEVVLPVTFSLLVRPGTTLEQVRRIATHPHAEAQCRAWVAANLPDALVVPASSNAAAAVAVADPESGYDAAIAGSLAAERYGLSTLREGLGGSDAHTRFVMVTKPGNPPSPTGSDKTSLVVFMRVDRTGALLEILEQFATRGVNLTRIESRPVGARLGNYSFSIDCEGHVADERVGEALMGLRRVCANVRFLGSYPRADGQPVLAAAYTSNDDFAEARRWLAGLRGRGGPSVPSDVTERAGAD